MKRKIFVFTSLLLVLLTATLSTACVGSWIKLRKRGVSSGCMQAINSVPESPRSPGRANRRNLSTSIRVRRLVQSVQFKSSYQPSKEDCRNEEF